MKKILKLTVIILLVQSTVWGQSQISEVNGNVGIGTTSPQVKLHVNGSQIIETYGSTTSSRTLTLMQSGTNQVHFPAYSGAWRSSIQIQNNNASKALFLAPPDGVDYNYAIFRAINGGLKLDVGGDFSNFGTNALTIEPSGNIGIGTSNPQARLHLSNGAVMASDPTYHNINVRMDGTSIPALKFTRWTGTASLQHNAFAGQFHNPILGEYSFGIGTGTSNSGDQDATSMVITTTLGGKVGIGTTTPRSRLDVGTSLQGGMLGTVLGRLPEGDGTGEGTFLGVRGYESQWTDYGGKSFALEHSFYGATNSSVNFYRGSGVTGGFITFNTDQNIEKMRITTNGNVGIGTTNPGQYKLAVEGNLGARKVVVTKASWADYVFEPNYSLPSLMEVEAFIKKYKHLPEVPSAKEVEENGLDVGENQAVLLKKIEELTLYAIEANKRNEALEKKNKELEERLRKLEDKLQ